MHTEPSTQPQRRPCRCKGVFHPHACESPEPCSLSRGRDGPHPRHGPSPGRSGRLVPPRQARPRDLPPPNDDETVLKRKIKPSQTANAAPNAARQGEDRQMKTKRRALTALTLMLAVCLLAGSQTISASIGLATDAINGLGKSAAETKELLSHIPVAYAVVYLWGTIGTGLILSIIGPKLLGVNLEEECKRYEAEMHGGLPVGSGGTAWRQIEMRAYQLKDGITPVGKTIAEAEAEHSESRIFVEGIRRDGKLIDFDETTVLQAGDIVAASARRDVIVTLGHNHEEVEDRELLDVPAESVDLVLTRKAFNGKTIMELAAEKFARGVYLSKITRGATSVDIPIMPKTTVHRGDILTIVGTRKHTDRVVEAVGYADRPTDATDMVWVGIAIVIGGLIGAITVPVSGVPITLSTSGGALIAGIILGWLRGVHPTFGRVPSGALWIMNSVGLNVFIAVVGISSGPTFVAGLQQVGFGIFFWGIFATSVPMLLAPLIGKYIFKFDPAINLGVCGGARTSTASVAMVGDVAKSSVPMLGYTVPYAVANTTLTLWGLVIVLLIA